MFSWSVAPLFGRGKLRGEVGGAVKCQPRTGQWCPLKRPLMFEERDLAVGAPTRLPTTNSLRSLLAENAELTMLVA